MQGKKEDFTQNRNVKDVCMCCEHHLVENLASTPLLMMLNVGVHFYVSGTNVTITLSPSLSQPLGMGDSIL